MNFVLIIVSKSDRIYVDVLGPGRFVKIFEVFLMAGFMVTNLSCPPPGKGPFRVGFGVSLFGFGGSFVVFGSV